MAEDTVEVGDIVSLEYTGKLDNGEVFDTSKHGDHSHPLEFEVGSGMVIKGFDNAVLGMKKGDKKEFRIPKDEAYGDRNPDLVKEFPMESLPQEIKDNAKPGLMITLGTPDGGRFPAQVLEVGEKNLKIDLNHPMAGKDLNFEVELVNLEKKSTEKSSEEKK